MEDYEETPGRIAQRNFNRFRIELGVRSNNEHAGSGLGGNPTEFLFVVNHTFKVYVDNTIRFADTASGEVIAYIPGHKTVKISDIRKEFSAFVKNHPDKIEVTNEQLTNLSFIKDLKVNHANMLSFIKGVEKAHELAHWLDIKKSFQSEISALFKKEVEFLETQFLKEIGLSESYFKDQREKEEQNRKDRLIDYNDQNRGDSPYNHMFIEHPIWGAKAKAAREREANMISNLLSKEDRDRMDFLGSLPSFVVLQVVRSIIHIDRIVALNLDEIWDVLGKINSEIRD